MEDPTVWIDRDERYSGEREARNRCIDDELPFMNDQESEVETFLDLHRRFVAAYESKNFVGVGYTGVQVNPDFVLAIDPSAPIVRRESSVICGQPDPYPYRVETKVAGVPFFSVFGEKEYERLSR